MRIDNWPLDRIMRLPDWCFGRRWWVGVNCSHENGYMSYAIADEFLPDKIVIWGTLITSRSVGALEPMNITMRLGNRVPANLAEAETLERIHKGISIPTVSYEFWPEANTINWINAERLIIESSGRTLVVAMIGDADVAYECTVAILISSMPKEVPDWLISGRDKEAWNM